MNNLPTYILFNDFIDIKIMFCDIIKHQNHTAESIKKLSNWSDQVASVHELLCGRLLFFRVYGKPLRESHIPLFRPFFCDCEISVSKGKFRFKTPFPRTPKVSGLLRSRKIGDGVPELPT